MAADVIFVGIIILVAVAAEGSFPRLKLSPVLAYLLIGFFVRFAADRVDFIETGHIRILDALASLGIAVLLFRVGLKSNVAALRAQLSRASLLWVGDFTASATLGFAVAYWVLGLSPAVSAVISVALTATSVGVTADVWARTGKLNTTAGELFIDVAELDDISGIVAVTALLSILTAHAATGGWTLDVLAGRLGLLALKLIVFAGLMYVFAHWVEPHVTRLFNRMGRSPHPILLITATGLLIAGTAEALGLSIAIGAFFAGLAFSRDPAAVHEDNQLEVLYSLFVPFFFIHVGMQVTPGGLSGGLLIGMVLLVAAVAGKFVGNFVPGALLTRPATAAVLGLSMIPRAEIALLVAQQASDGGFIPTRILSAIVVVSAITCLVVPWVLELILRPTPVPEG